MISGPRSVLVLFVVVAAIATPVAAASEDAPDIVGVSFQGDTVGVRGDTTYLWRTGDHHVSTNVTRYPGSNSYQLCAKTTISNGTSTDLGCTPISKNGTHTVSFGDWPAENGQQEVTVTVHHAIGDGGAVTNQTTQVYVMDREADEDGDSLSNQREAKLGTDIFSLDTDQDGIEDGAEVDTYGTDPLSEDTDNDGLLDGTEVNGKTNVTDPDTDGDGLLDGDEVNEHGTNPVNPDTDGDGLTDSEEVKVYGTDPLEQDTDADGLTDYEEVNKYGTNPRKVHTDSDGLSDGTEVALGTWPGSALDVVILGLVAVLVLGVGVRTAAPRLVAAVTDVVDVSDSEAETSGDTQPSDERPPTRNEVQVQRPESDDEKVLKLLREAGGSLPQKQIVESTEWSSSKVSRLLTKMDDEGTVTKTTIGRENYIQLTEETATQSDE